MPGNERPARPASLTAATVISATGKLTGLTAVTGQAGLTGLITVTGQAGRRGGQAGKRGWLCQPEVAPLCFSDLAPPGAGCGGGVAL
jgi:hypothetical protein